MNIMFLFYSNLVVWAGVAGYILLLARKQAELDRRLEQLELMKGERNHV
jgi:CcmD family protein